MVTYQYHYRELAALSGEPAAGPRPAAVWLPTEWLATHSVARPAMAEKKWRPLLGYLLEEQLVDDPDSLHFAVVASSAETLQVQVLACAAVESAINSARASGLQLVALVPDFYALGWDGETAQLAIDAGRWLVRLSEHQGLAGPAALVEPLLREWLEQHPAAKFAVANPAAEPLGEPLARRASVASGTINWQFAALPAVNLLQGRYRPAAVGGGLRALRRAAPMALWSLLLVLAATLFIGINGAVNQRDLADLNRYRNYLAEQLVAGGSQLDAGLLAATVRRDSEQLRGVAALREAPHYQLAVEVERLLMASGARAEVVSWRGDELTLTARGEQRALTALRRGLTTTSQALLVAIELTDSAPDGGQLVATLRSEAPL